MKEFSAQTGGRYTYVDDIVNLQELSLAFASIFNNCDNFIISGCEISGTSISEGYVYINGKIRRFTGVSGITTWPQYIYESNKTETVAYASGSDKVGRNVYGCSIAKTVPTTLDPLTGATPSFIKLTSGGGLTMNDALFGKYALLLKSAAGQQTVSDIITFNNNDMRAWKALLSSLQANHFSCECVTYQIPAVVSSKAQKSIEGSYSNIVGFPTETFEELLKEFGFKK